MIAIEKERSEFEAAYKAEWPKSTGLHYQKNLQP